MSDLALGQATIVYEDPEGGTTTETVDNEQLVYVRDHWAVRSGTDDAGNDLMKQVPRDRVYSVERNVQQFEEEARTVRHRVESLAAELGRRLPVDVGDGRGRERGRSRETDEGPVRVPVEGSPGTDEGEDSTEYGP